MGVENTAVTVVCQQNGICHCDWRMTITGCEESEFLRTTYIVNAVWCTALAIFELILLAHRIFWLKQTFFDYDRDLKSFVKIKPLQGLLLATSLSFALRAVSAVLLILDILPNNILRSLIFDIAWQPGFMGATIYFVGIINTLPRLLVIDRSWLPSSKSLDILASILIFGPPITNNFLAIATGYCEDTGRIMLAKIFIYIYCGVWFLYCSALSAGLAYFGWRLTIVINRNIAKVADLGTTRYVQLKKALNKLRIVFSSLTVCFMVLGISVLIYIFQRDQILSDLDRSISTFIPWTFAINILGTVSIATIAASSPIFSGLEGSRHGSHLDVSKGRNTSSGFSSRAASMERDWPNSNIRVTEKSSLDQSKRMAKTDEEADIGHERIASQRLEPLLEKEEGEDSRV